MTDKGYLSFCRDCLTDLIGIQRRCTSCRSPRIIQHGELGILSIAHIDCDSFFAAVEKRDDPKLANIPVVVGGSQRGVVSTCCYIARTYGIHSAMPIFKAKKLCPNAVFLPPRHDRYKSVSAELKKLLFKLTPKIEFSSIDEGYLDLSGTLRLHGTIPAKSLAKAVIEIEEKLGITVSIGLSYNKTLAKIASTFSKPRGFSIIGKSDTDKFLSTLPVRKINGVGRKFSKRLGDEGIITLGDISKKNKRDLISKFGESMASLFNLLEKNESSLITNNTKRKSISTEKTFSKNLSKISEIKKFLWEASVRISDEAKSKQVSGRTIQLKLKKDNFKLLTRSLTLQSPSQFARDIYPAALLLLEREINHAPFRLIGVGLENFEASDDQQIFNDLLHNKATHLENATDKIRKKYGNDSIFPGLLLTKS